MESFTLELQIFFYAVLAISLVPMVYRIIRGPHVLDRIMCIDPIALIIICIIAVWKITVGTAFFFDAVLVLAIVGFISTAALAKYLENGDLIE